MSVGYNGWYQPNITVGSGSVQFSIELKLQHPVQELEFQKAADYTVKLLPQHRPIFLAMSGGIDSEFAAEVLLRNKIPFTPIIAVFGDLIEHHYALYWCKVNKVTPQIVQLKPEDIIPIAEEVAIKLKAYCAASVIPLYLADLAEKQGGYLIVGEPTIGSRPYDFETAIGEQFKFGSNQFFVDILRPNKHVGGFLTYTPELLLATAKGLDTSLNDPMSRAKLYGVPYRPKVQPVSSPLSWEERDRIHTTFGVHSYGVTPDIVFLKHKIIEVLTGEKHDVL